MCEDIAVESAVLAGVLFEGVGVGGTLLCGECFDSGLRVFELVFLCGLRFGGCSRVGVADLRGEACAVHLLEDNLRVFADFAPEGLEGDFEFDFGHKSFRFQTPLVPLQRGKRRAGLGFRLVCKAVSLVSRALFAMCLSGRGFYLLRCGVGVQVCAAQTYTATATK